MATRPLSTSFNSAVSAATRKRRSLLNNRRSKHEIALEDALHDKLPFRELFRRRRATLLTAFIVLAVLVVFLIVLAVLFTLGNAVHVTSATEHHAHVFFENTVLVEYECDSYHVRTDPSVAFIQSRFWLLYDPTLDGHADRRTVLSVVPDLSSNRLILSIDQETFWVNHTTLEIVDSTLSPSQYDAVFEDLLHHPALRLTLTMMNTLYSQYGYTGSTHPTLAPLAMLALSIQQFFLYQPPAFQCPLTSLPCLAHGSQLNATQCANNCEGSCGYECRCTHSICGDCCAHSGCAAIRGVSESLSDGARLRQMVLSAIGCLYGHCC